MGLGEPRGRPPAALLAAEQKRRSRLRCQRSGGVQMVPRRPLGMVNRSCFIRRPVSSWALRLAAWLGVDPAAVAGHQHMLPGTPDMGQREPKAGGSGASRGPATWVCQARVLCAVHALGNTRLVRGQHAGRVTGFLTRAPERAQQGTRAGDPGSPCPLLPRPRARSDEGSACATT